jgi:hypothetical protein
VAIAPAKDSVGTNIIAASNLRISVSLFSSVSRYIDSFKAGRTFPSVYLSSLNHLAVLSWAHVLAAGAVSLVGACGGYF